MGGRHVLEKRFKTVQMLRTSPTTCASIASPGKSEVTDELSMQYLHAHYNE